MGFFDGLKNKLLGKKETGKYLSGFAKTNNTLGKKLRFITKDNITNKEDFVEQLMVTLIESDLGYKTADHICDKFFKETQEYIFLTKDDVMDILLATFDDIYKKEVDKPIVYNQNGPTVIFLVGVNGSGKTSSCAKLANRFLKEGKKVVLAAGDTFRAGATEQLAAWGEKLGIEVIKGKPNQDPSSVLVDACRFAKEAGADILLCDTAGRLQNKLNLMAELAKMRKVVGREIEGAPHNIWLVLDGNTGQNGMSQAILFDEVTQLDGIILTKMDGTSKGGIIIAIKDLLGIPVRFITLGETLEDIQDFDFDMYLYSIIEDLNNAS